MTFTDISDPDPPLILCTCTMTLTRALRIPTLTDTSVWNVTETVYTLTFKTHWTLTLHTFWSHTFRDTLDSDLYRQFGSKTSQTIWNMILTDHIWPWPSEIFWTLTLRDTDPCPLHRQFISWPHRHFELWPSQTLWTLHSHIHTLDHDPHRQGPWVSHTHTLNPYFHRHLEFQTFTDKSQN